MPLGPEEDPMQTEQQLIESAQAGDEYAFEQIYEEYFDRIYSYIAARIGNRFDSETTPIEDTISSKGPSPEERAVTNIAVERVKQALSKLTQAQQQVLSLRLASGISVAETAKIMGKSQGAVKASQHSALAAIRRIFAAEHGEY